jgi:hypothetical protein
MIVREVIRQPDLIDKIDFFNDAKDTIAWLKDLGHFDLAARLQKQFDLWARRKFSQPSNESWVDSR